MNLCHLVSLVRTMSIHFKFKSAKEYDTVHFPGIAIRLIDLKKAIVDKKKLAKGLDFDLVITDAQNGSGNLLALYLLIDGEDHLIIKKIR